MRCRLPRSLLPEGTRCSAAPAVAAAVERWWGGPVDLIGDAERALAAARGGVNLRQFDLAPRHRGLRALRLLGQAALAPAWRPVRIGLAALVVLGGVLTAVPLLLFAIAARRMPLSTLGFIQYLAPSIVFILGLTVFEQPLAPAKLLSFLFIWAAVGIFVADTLHRSRAPRPA